MTLKSFNKHNVYDPTDYTVFDEKGDCVDWFTVDHRAMVFKDGRIIEDNTNLDKLWFYESKGRGCNIRYIYVNKATNALDVSLTLTDTK